MKLPIETRDSVAIFLLSLILFTFAPNPDFIAFQTRFALFVQEMFRHGPSFFPMTYLGPYPDYPVLPTFLSYVSALFFGKITPFSTMLPFSIFSSCILVVIYRIGALCQRQWGLYGVLFALLTILFFQESRTFSPDQGVSLVTALSFYMVYSAQVLGRFRRLFLLPVLFLLGFLMRGPIGLIVPAAVSCGFYLCEGDFGSLLKVALVALSILMIGCTLLVLMAFLQGGAPFVKDVLLAQAVGRVGQSDNLRFGFYVLDNLGSYALAFPMAVCVVLFQLKKILRPKNKTALFLRQLLFWALIILVGFSLASTKKPRYLLAMVPAISLLAAYPFIDTTLNKAMLYLKRFMVGACLCLPFIICLLAVILVWKSQIVVHLDAHYVWVIALSLALSVISMGLYWRYHQALSVLGIAVLVFALMNIFVVERIYYQLENTRSLAATILILENTQNRPIVFYQIYPDTLDIKLAAALAKPFNYQFLFSEQALLQNRQDQSLFIAKQKVFDALPSSIKAHFKVIAHDRVGHAPVVLFEENAG